MYKPVTLAQDCVDQWCLPILEQLSALYSACCNNQKAEDSLILETEKYLFESFPQLRPVCGIVAVTHLSVCPPTASRTGKA